jgi:hypothetical protein
MKKGAESYEFIGKLAIGIWPQGIKIRLTALVRILNDKGADYSDRRRGPGAVVAAACQYWEKKDPVIAHAISYAFTGKNDEYLA